MSLESTQSSASTDSDQKDMEKPLFYAYGVIRTLKPKPEDLELGSNRPTRSKLLLLTFANRDVAEEWWSHVRAVDPDAVRPNPQLMTFEYADEQGANIWDREEFAALESKWIQCEIFQQPVVIPIQVGWSSGPLCQVSASAVEDLGVLLNDVEESNERTWEVLEQTAGSGRKRKVIRTRVYAEMRELRDAVEQQRKDIDEVALKLSEVIERINED